MALPPPDDQLQSALLAGINQPGIASDSREAAPRGDGADEGPPRTRILVYSHDSYGLGHLRRSLNLAEALRDWLPHSAVLVVSGSTCATHFPIPPGVDVMKIPSVTKNGLGDYVSRSLPFGLDAVVGLRRSCLREAYRAFRPHLLLVDNKPLGIGDELSELLEEAHENGTALILGIRDILDRPEAVEAEWSRPTVLHALSRLYDRICIYGSPEIFDPRLEYPAFRPFAGRLEFTGYVVRPLSQGALQAAPAGPPEVLVTAGGGEDGADWIEAYLRSVGSGPPPSWRSHVVLGPLMSLSQTRRIRQEARRLPGVMVHRFYPDMPKLLARSRAVVSMAGYNIVAEILRSRVPAVLCPRSWPRREQVIRATRLASRGLADVVREPDPAALRRAVERALEKGPAKGVLPALDGAERMARVTAEVIQASQEKEQAGRRSPP